MVVPTPDVPSADVRPSDVPTSHVPPSDDLSTLILTAMAREVRPLARALTLVRSDVGSVPAWRRGAIRAAVVGVGPALAAATTVRLLDLLPVDRVLVVGIAGGRDPALAVGDVVAPESVVDASTGLAFRPAHFGGVARHGTLVTVSHLGAGLPDTLVAPALAVDMESAAIAAVCDGRGIPWDVRRAVSDLPGTVVPSLASLVRSDGWTDPMAVLRLLVRRPGEVPRLLRLGRGTRCALRALVAAVSDDLRG